MKCSTTSSLKSYWTFSAQNMLLLLHDCKEDWKNEKVEKSILYLNVLFKILSLFVLSSNYCNHVWFVSILQEKKHIKKFWNICLKSSLFYHFSSYISSHACNQMGLKVFPYVMLRSEVCFSNSGVNTTG